MVIIPEIRDRYKKEQTIIVGFNENNVKETIQKKIEKKENYLDLECSICTEKIIDNEIVKLKCNHVFHLKCLTSWKNINNSCPLCREEITDQTILELKN